MAVGGSRQHILNSHFYSPWTMFCFGSDQSVVSFQPRLMIRMDFPRKSRIDRIIQNAFECGLFEKWNRDSQRKKQHIVRYDEETPLTSKNYSFMVLIFGSGLIMGTLALFSEIIISRNMMKSRRWRMWEYFEQFLDGKRNHLQDLTDTLIKSRK